MKRMTILLTFLLTIMLTTAARGAVVERYVYQQNGTSAAFSGSWLYGSNVMDSDWYTQGSAAPATSYAMFYMNYTRPGGTPESKTALLWEVRGGNNTNPAIYNLSMPSDCYSGLSTIQVRANSSWVIGDINVHWDCYNGTQWNQVANASGLDGAANPGLSVWDEQLIWNVTQNESGLSVSANPGWTTNQNDIIISCTYNTSLPINVTLVRDGVTVSNPYSATMDNGLYNFTCYANDTLGYYPGHVENNLTITADYFQCTNTSTFAFSKNLTGLQGDNITLDFSAAVTSHHVKTDLSDVYSPRNGWINTTGGYYFTINITGLDSVMVQFGNYLGNASYSVAPNSLNVTTMSQYDQANSYYLFTTRDEMLNTEQIPPGSNVSMTVYCSSGQTLFNANDTRILVPTFDSQLTAFRSTVNYPGDYYTRDYLVDNPVESRTIYDADAYDFSVLQIPIYVNDYSFYDAEITIYKTVSGQPVVITEGHFDNEHKFVAYLIQDEPYYIRLTKGSTIREAGFFKPVTAGSLTLNINAISLSPSLEWISDYISVSAANTSLTNIQVVYNDSSGGTQAVRIRVYEDTNQTAFFDNTYSGVQSLSVGVTPINMTAHYYSVKFDVTHSTYGNSDVTFTRRVAGPGFVRFGLAPSWIYGVVGFIILLFMSLAVTPKDRLVGLVFIIVGVAILGSLTWTVLDPGILTLIVIFAGVSVVYEIKRGGFV